MPFVDWKTTFRSILLLREFGDGRGWNFVRTQRSRSQKKGFLAHKPMPVCLCYLYACMHAHLAVFLATLWIKKGIVIALELVPIKIAEAGTPGWRSGKSM